MSDTLDIIILTELYKGNPTIEEIAVKADRAKSWIHDRLAVLVEEELVAPPRKRGAARDYSLTETGKVYLETNGYVRVKVFDNENEYEYRD